MHNGAAEGASPPLPPPQRPPRPAAPGVTAARGGARGAGGGGRRHAGVLAGLSTPRRRIFMQGGEPEPEQAPPQQQQQPPPQQQRQQQQQPSPAPPFARSQSTPALPPRRSLAPPMPLHRRMRATAPCTTLPLLGALPASSGDGRVVNSHSADVVYNWLMQHAGERARLAPLAALLDEQLAKAATESGPGGEPSARRTALAADALLELVSAMRGRVGAVFAPAVRELLSAAISNSDLVLAGGASASFAAPPPPPPPSLPPSTSSSSSSPPSHAAPARPPAGEDAAGEGEEPGQAEAAAATRSVVPYFRVCSEMEAEVERLKQLMRQRYERRRKLWHAQASRYVVLDATVNHRQAQLVVTAMLLWRRNVAVVRAQRAALLRVFDSWASPAATAKPHFLSWRNWMNAQRRARLRRAIARAEDKAQQLRREEEEAKESAAAYETDRRRVGAELAQLGLVLPVLREQLAALRSHEAAVANRDAAAVTRLAAQMAQHALLAAEQEIHFFLDRAASLSDPRLLLAAALQPAQAAAVLPRLPPQALVLCWMNFQLGLSGTQRKANNFSLDMEDSECLIRVLAQVTPRASPLGEPLPQLRLAKVSQDLEGRAQYLLTTAAKIDSLLAAGEEAGAGAGGAGTRSDARFIHQLLTPGDIVGSACPDLVAAWMAQTMCQRFSAPLDVTRARGELLTAVRRLAEEAGELAAAAERAVSAAWLQQFCMSFARVYEEAQRALRDMQEAARLTELVQRRVRAFLVETLLRRLRGDAARMTDFRRDRERVALLALLEDAMLADLVLPDAPKQPTQQQQQQQQQAPPPPPQQQPRLRTLTRAQQQELAAVRRELSTHYEPLVAVFRFYSASDLDSRPSTMNASEFRRFVTECCLLRRPEPAALAAAQRLAAGGGEAGEGHAFGLVELLQQFALVASGMSVWRVRRQALVAVARAASIPVELIADAPQRATTGDEGLEVDVAAFAQLLVRLAARRFPALPRLSDRVRVFLHCEVLRFARQLDIFSFNGRMRRRAMLDVLAQYRDKLEKVFLFYATSLSEAGVSKATKARKRRRAAQQQQQQQPAQQQPQQPVQQQASQQQASQPPPQAGPGAQPQERAARWQNTIDYSEFLTLLDDCGMLRKDAAAEAAAGSAPADASPPASTGDEATGGGGGGGSSSSSSSSLGAYGDGQPFVTHRDVHAIFQSIQVHHAHDGSAPERFRQDAPPALAPAPAEDAAAAAAAAAGADAVSAVAAAGVAVLGDGAGGGGGGGGGPDYLEGTDLKCAELQYSEFLEALTALGCIRNPDPFLSHEARLVAFLERDVFPALRRRVQMGGTAQAAAIKNLI